MREDFLQPMYFRDVKTSGGNDEKIFIEKRN